MPYNGAADESRCPLNVYVHQGRRLQPLVRARSAPGKRMISRSPVKAAWNAALTVKLWGASALARSVPHERLVMRFMLILPRLIWPDFDFTAFLFNKPDPP